eukprot:5381483-Amphidinium_carterae.1
MSPYPLKRRSKWTLVQTVTHELDTRPLDQLHRLSYDMMHRPPTSDCVVCCRVNGTEMTSMSNQPEEQRRLVGDLRADASSTESPSLMNEPSQA